MLKLKHLLRAPEGEGGAAAGGGVAAAAADGGAAAAAGGAADAGGAGAAADGKDAAGEGKGAAAGDAGKAGETKGFWNDTWRERLAGDDPKALAQLARYASPEDVWRKARSLEQKLSSGEYRPVLPKDAKPEDVKAFREAHGIPEKPEGYDLKGVKFDESDKPMIDVMLKAAHASNQTSEQVKATVQTWAAVKKAAIDHQATADKKVEEDAEETLRAEWGGEYKRNMNLFRSALDRSMPQDQIDNFLGGRLADGTPIGSAPQVIKAILGMELMLNPRGVLVPGGEGDHGEGLKTELEKLQNIPANKKTTQQDQRQRDLIDAAIAGGHMDKNGNWKK